MIRYRNDTTRTKTHGRQQPETKTTTPTDKQLRNNKIGFSNKNFDNKSGNPMAIDAITKTSKHETTANNYKSRPLSIHNQDPDDDESLKDIRGDPRTNTDDSTSLNSTLDTLDLSLSTISANSGDDVPHTPDLTNVSSFQSRDATDDCSTARSFNTTIDFISLHPDIHITSESLTDEGDEYDHTRHDNHLSDLTDVSSRIDTNRSLFNELDDDTSSTAGIESVGGRNGNFMASTPRRCNANEGGDDESEENVFKPVASSSQRRERTIFEEIVETQTEIVVESTYEVETNNNTNHNNNNNNNNKTEQIQIEEEKEILQRIPSTAIIAVGNEIEKDFVVVESCSAEKIPKIFPCNNTNNNKNTTTAAAAEVARATRDNKDNIDSSRNPPLLTDVEVAKRPSSSCNNKDNNTGPITPANQPDSNFDRTPLPTKTVQVASTKPATENQSDSKSILDLTDAAATSEKSNDSLKDNEISTPQSCGIELEEVITPFKSSSVEEEEKEEEEEYNAPLDESTLSLADGDVLDTTMDLKEAVIGEQKEPLNMAKALLYKDDVAKEEKRSPGVKRRKGIFS